MNPIETAWLAGIIEGEGCFHPNGASTRLVIEVGMTDEDVIAKLHSTSGLGTMTGPFTDSRGPNRKLHWRWRVFKQAEAWALAAQLLPHLGQRRSMRLLELWETYLTDHPHHTHYFALPGSLFCWTELDRIDNSETVDATRN